MSLIQSTSGTSHCVMRETTAGGPQGLPANCLVSSIKQPRAGEEIAELAAGERPNPARRVCFRCR